MNREFISFAVSSIGTGILLAQLLIVVLAGIFFFSRLQPKDKNSRYVLSFLADNSLAFAFLVTTVSTLGSLFLSEIAHFPPCKLCWYQRIFMYPQTVILGIGLLKNDKNAKLYGIALSTVGLAIAIYHYLLQMFPSVLIPCSDEVANCSLVQFKYFGYITIPMMSGTAFTLILVLLLLGLRKR